MNGMAAKADKVVQVKKVSKKACRVDISLKFVLKAKTSEKPTKRVMQEEVKKITPSDCQKNKSKAAGPIMVIPKMMSKRPKI